MTADPAEVSADQNFFFFPHHVIELCVFHVLQDHLNFVFLNLQELQLSNVLHKRTFS